MSTMNGLMAAPARSDSDASASSSRGSTRELAGFARALSVAIDVFNPGTQLVTLQLFCEVALRQEVAMIDLTKAFAISGAAVSRNCDLLGGGSIHRKGFKLVDVFDDPMDRRFKRVRITSKGAELARGLLDGLRALTK